MAENPFFKFEKLSDALKTNLPEGSKVKINRQKKSDEYELLEYWGAYDQKVAKEDKVTIKKLVPHWIMVINRSVVIRGIPNPYNHQMPPYIKTKLFEDCRPSWFGIGIGEVGYGTQERLNKMVNQRLDNVDLVINRQIVANANDPKINRNSLQRGAPGKVHWCSDIDKSIKWQDIPDVTQSSYKEEELAKQDYRQATGATAPLLPADKSEQHRTAMGIQMLQGAAGERFRPVLRQIEIDGIQQTAQFYFSNLQQFMTQDEWVLKTSDNGQTEPVLITPLDLQAKAQFIPTGLSETMNKEIQVGQLLRYKDSTANDPTVNRAEINKRIGELMGFKELHKLIVPQGPMQTGGSLGQEDQAKIRQRLAEGASKEQIKEEILGPRPPQQGGPGG